MSQAEEVTGFPELLAGEKFVCAMPSFLSEGSINILVRIAERRSGETVYWRHLFKTPTAITTGDVHKVRKALEMILPRDSSGKV